jgi:hypothetical protein
MPTLRGAVSVHSTVCPVVVQFHPLPADAVTPSIL